PEGAGGERRRTWKVPALQKQEGGDDELGAHRCGHHEEGYTCRCTRFAGRPPPGYPRATCLGRRDIPTEVALGPPNGSPEDCVASADTAQLSDPATVVGMTPEEIADLVHLRRARDLMDRN